MLLLVHLRPISYAKNKLYRLKHVWYNSIYSSALYDTKFSLQIALHQSQSCEKT